MTVKRIVTNVAAKDVAAARVFYCDFLGLEVLMDQGWITTFGSDHRAPVQISVAREGGSGTEVPDISIEVDDLEEIYDRARAAGLEIAYPLTDEPWGVRRFYLRDPFGKLINILAHAN